MSTRYIEADAKGKMPEVTFDFRGPRDDEEGPVLGFSVMYGGTTFAGDPMLLALYFEALSKSLIALHNAISLCESQGKTVDQTCEILDLVPLAVPYHGFYRMGLNL